MTYAPADLIGKTLYAVKPIPLKKLPDPNTPTIYTVSPGKIVGVIDSFILPKAGRNQNLFWQFKDQNNGLYYAEQVQGNFSTSALSTQGVLSLEEKKVIAEEENESWFEKIKGVGLWLGIGTGAFILLRDQLKK